MKTFERDLSSLNKLIRILKCFQLNLFFDKIKLQTRVSIRVKQMIKRSHNCWYSNFYSRKRKICCTLNLGLKWNRFFLIFDSKIKLSFNFFDTPPFNRHHHFLLFFYFNQYFRQQMIIILHYYLIKSFIQTNFYLFYKEYFICHWFLWFIYNLGFK